MRPIITTLALLLLLLLAGCTTTRDVKPLTHVDHDYGQTEDEQRLFKRSQETHQELERKGYILKDPEITTYIERIARPLVPKQAAKAGNFRFYVVRDPTVNAFAMPNGGIYLHLGLLARLENELQLAHLLAHEITHVVKRHGLRGYDERRWKTTTGNIMGAFIGPTLGELPFVASIASHKREYEEEADAMALDILSNNGYNITNAPAFFDVLEEVKNPERVEGSIWSSHPDSKKRKASAIAIVQSGTIAVNPKGRVGKKAYEKVRTKLVKANLDMQLLSKHYSLALEAIDRELRFHPQDAELFYYRGEVFHRMFSDPEGAAQEYAWLYDKTFDDELKKKFTQRKGEFSRGAHQAYNKAIKLNGITNAYRGKGLLAYKQKQFSDAIPLLEHYLSHGKNIRDRRYITRIIQEMRKT